MANPWRVRRGVYELKDDTKENREALVEALTAKVRKDGNKSNIKGILLGNTKKPYRISTNSIKDLFDNKTDKLKIGTKNSNRTKNEIRPGANVKAGTKTAKQTKELTNQFIERVSGIEGSTPEKIQRYFKENNKALRNLYVQVGTENQRLLKAGKDPNQRISRGHYARLSRSIDSPRNLFIELLTENIAKGDKYSPNPAAMLAIGNPVKEGRSALENWALDYTTWLNKPENGGDGILAQRGDYNDLLEQKFNQITGEQWNKLDPTQQKKAIDTSDDLVHDTEKLNQFLPSEGADRRKWGLLSPDQYEQGLAWINDRDYRKRIGKPIGETTELARPLGGIGDTMKVGGGLRRADQALNLGTNIATGNVAGAAVGGGVLAASEILKNPAAQKAIAGQVARLGASRAGKTMLKTIPGLDVLISGGEAMSYLSQGRLGQAGIATLSGAIGWIPIVGDGASAALDLTNTGIDISRLQGSPTQTPRKKKKIKWGNQPTTRLKFGI